MRVGWGSATSRVPASFHRAELKENTKRVDLDDYETSRQRGVEVTRERAAIAERKLEAEGYLSGESPEKSPQKHQAHDRQLRAILTWGCFSSTRR